ncbi:MAG: UvrD-helicase domain-containing protein [Ruminococcaceae bacterium]|nr:UvrD-helicase domain-containing protein [Oscillospiraceae bacterium]
MGLIKKIIAKHKERVKVRNEACDNLIAQVDTAIQEINLLFSDSQSFVDPGKEIEWSNHNASLIADMNIFNIQKLKKATHYKMLLEKQAELYRNANSLKQQISVHNDRVADAKIQNAYALIGNVEGRKLDKQQMTCIVKDAHNHLVIAGAGTGKTTTVVGKIKFLLKSGKYKPEDILVLSFTNASASEMSQRINQETGCNIDASTFHKLGLNIITKVNGIVPKITQLNLRKFVKEQLLLNMQSDAYLNLLSSYLLYNRVVSKSEFEFKTQSEYEEYLRLNPPTTINNETVKSYGEMDIANFLTQNGIQYIYEHPYKVDTRTSEYGQYNPDFYLPEYDIYIEYFGINKDGEVPSYFKGVNGMTATQSYQASMKWKRETHSTNDTILIECYAYEKFDGVLLDNLKEKLSAKDVKLTPKTTKELWEQVSADGDSILDGVIELFETVINLIKSNGYTIATVRQLNIGNSNAQNNNMVLSLLEPIFNAYCNYLSEHKEIDFNDMINMATKYVEQGKYVSPYKYVIVDEYQDISKARYSLLCRMRESNDYDLFCVGDDWQSIYRFAGSDIGYILNFEQYWGSTEISKIETTYRFTQKLIEISGNFIMQNPVQIKKSIKGKNDTVGFALGEISGYTDKFSIEFMTKKLEDLPRGSSVFFIGRYSFDAKLLSDSGLFECQYNNVSGFVEVKYRKRIDLKMSFITAHKSKGLQADYIFIINNKKSRMGFPSKIQDAAILNLLLDNCDQYPYAEERRLFYVALTRAKKKAFLVTVKNQESEFAMELKERYGEELKREQWECPLCGGKLLKKSGPYGEFYGCSNYRSLGCKYKRNIK